MLGGGYEISVKNILVIIRCFLEVGCLLFALFLPPLMLSIFSFIMRI